MDSESHVVRFMITRNSAILGRDFYQNEEFIKHASLTIEQPWHVGPWALRRRSSEVQFLGKRDSAAFVMSRRDLDTTLQPSIV